MWNHSEQITVGEDHRRSQQWLVLETLRLVHHLSRGQDELAPVRDPAEEERRTLSTHRRPHNGL